MSCLTWRRLVKKMTKEKTFLAHHVFDLGRKLVKNNTKGKTFLAHDVFDLGRILETNVFTETDYKKLLTLLSV